MKKLMSPLAIVFAIIFIDLLGVGILIPVIPLLLTDPAYDYHLAGISVTQGYVLLGLLTAIFPFMQFLATPILGQLSDRVGRRPVLAFSLLGTSFSYVIFAIGIILQNIPILFISRALDGITGGNIAVAQAAIADISPPEKRAKNFGILGAAFGLGFIVGPFLGGRLSDPSVLPWFNATTPFWFAAIIAFLNMLAVVCFFRETLKTKSHDAFHFAQAFINVKKAFMVTHLRKLFTASFLFQSGFAFFTTFFGAFLIFKFSFTQGQIGDYFAFVGLCIALTQVFVTARIGKLFSSHTIIAVALFGVALTTAAFAVVPASWMLYFVALPQAVCMGLIMANLTALISRSGGANEQGGMLGIAASVQGLGQSIPPVIAGIVAAHFSPTAPILVGSAIILLAWAVFTFTVRKTENRTSGQGDLSTMTALEP